MSITRWYFLKQGLHINVSAEGEKNESVTIPVTGASAIRISMMFLSKEGTALFSGVSTTHLAPRLVAIAQPKQTMLTHVGVGVTIRCYEYHMTRTNFHIPASSIPCHQTLPPLAKGVARETRLVSVILELFNFILFLLSLLSVIISLYSLILFFSSPSAITI